MGVSHDGVAVDPTLIVRGLRRAFGARAVLDGVDLTVAAGERVALIGENGAGKSTLLRIVAGLLPFVGEVLIDGHSLQRDRAAALGCVGYVPDALPLPAESTVAEWLSLVASLRRAPPPTAQALRDAEIEGWLGRPLGVLSLGQRRRVSWVAARIGGGRLLLLDEPTNGLDADARERLFHDLTRHTTDGGAVLMATHEAALIDGVADRVVRLECGKLIDRRPSTSPSA
jgi:ABC-2 type transport system ATP-binding protein